MPHVRFGRESSDVDYYFNDGTTRSVVPTLSVVKDLGIIYTKNLDFTEHIEKISTKALPVSTLILTSFQYLGNKSKINLYKSLVRPILEYAPIIWIPSKIGIIRKLEKIQKRSLSLSKSESYLHVLERCNITTLRYRRSREDLIQLYKLLHSTSPIEVKFNPRLRGHKYKLLKVE